MMEDYKKFLEDMRYDRRRFRAIRARRRFKALVRRVIQNRFWLEGLTEVQDFTDNIWLNIKLVTSKMRSKGTIQAKDKVILRKHVDTRTASEKRYLAAVFCQSTFFDRYPEEMKKHLATVVTYEFFGPHRVLIRQGDEPEAMYLLLSGKVGVTVTTFNRHLNEYVTHVLKDIEVGGIFGEMAIMYNIKRSATITTKSPCEFLKISKHHFKDIIQEVMTQKFDTVKEHLGRFRYFDKWSGNKKLEFCFLAKLHKFSRGEIVAGDGIGYTDNVYFVMKGTCCLIEHMYLRIIHLKNNRKSYKLYRHRNESNLQLQIETAKLECGNMSDLRPQNSIRKSLFITDTFLGTLPEGVETHFVHVCDFAELSCFNVGENMKNRRVVAMDDVEIMSVPRYLLLQNNSDDTWTKVRDFLEKTIPDTERIFARFMEVRRWEAHKKKFIASLPGVAVAKLRNKNRINNVPYSIRINHTAYK